jgi:hypothetical protein
VLTGHRGGMTAIGVDGGGVAGRPDAVDAGRQAGVDRQTPQPVEHDPQLPVQRVGLRPACPNREAAGQPLPACQSRPVGAYLRDLRAGQDPDPERTQGIFDSRLCAGPERGRYVALPLDQGYRCVVWWPPCGPGDPSQHAGELCGNLDAGEASADNGGAECSVRAIAECPNCFVQRHRPLVSVEAMYARGARWQGDLAARAEEELVVTKLTTAACQPQLPAVGVDSLDRLLSMIDSDRRQQACQRDAHSAEIGLVEAGPDHKRVVGADEGDGDPALGSLSTK